MEQKEHATLVADWQKVMSGTFSISLTGDSVVINNQSTNLADVETRIRNLIDSLNVQIGNDTTTIQKKESDILELQDKLVALTDKLSDLEQQTVTLGWVKQERDDLSQELKKERATVAQLKDKLQNQLGNPPQVAGVSTSAHIDPKHIYLASRSTWLVGTLGDDGVVKEKPMRPGTVHNLGKIASTGFRDDMVMARLATAVIPMAMADAGEDFFISAQGMRVDIKQLLQLRERSNVAFWDQLEAQSILPWCGLWEARLSLRGCGMQSQDYTRNKEASMEILGKFHDFVWPSFTAAKADRPALVTEAPVVRDARTVTTTDGKTWYVVPKTMYPVHRIYPPRTPRNAPNNSPIANALRNHDLHLFQPVSGWENHMVFGEFIPKKNKEKKVLYLGKNAKYKVDFPLTLGQVG